MILGSVEAGASGTAHNGESITEISVLPVQGSGVVGALRRATAGMHHDLERRSPISLKSPDLESYVLHLWQMKHWLQMLDRAGVLTPLEQALAEAGIETLPLLEWLQDDLEACGEDLAASVPPLEEVEAAWAGRFVCPSPQPYLLGIGYVLEGSRMGSAHIRRAYALYHPGLELSFLREGRESTGERWRRVIAVLEAQSVRTGHVGSLCSGAVAAFSSLLHVQEAHALARLR